MKKIGLILILIMASATPGHAILGISVGARGGIASGVDLAVEDNIPGISLDKMNMIGLQFKFGLLPKVDLLFTGDYYWKTVDFTIPSTSTSAEFTVHDLALTASAVYPYKMRFITPYAGAGIATHAFGFSGKGFAIPADDSQFGYHLIGGVSVSPSFIPLGVNGEIRLNWIQTEGETSDFVSFHVGVNLGLL